MQTLNSFQEWQVANGHHVTEQVGGDEVHVPELCPLCDTAERYAAKWRADGHDEEPTDEALRAAFAHCVRPARPYEYDAIRASI